MKLTREEIVRVKDASPLDPFRQAIKSEATLGYYTSTLRLVVCEFLEDVLKGTFEERVSQLVDHAREDPLWARDLCISLSGKLRARTKLPEGDEDHLNPASIANYFKPIKKLFDMNDIVLSWSRVYATYPESYDDSRSRGWAREEISVMLRHVGDVIDRALILVLASSGVRVGGLDLTWGDVQPIYRVDGKLVMDPGVEGEIACAVLHVYRGSPEHYCTFITPEALAALQDYGRLWAKLKNRQPREDDPVFITRVGMPKNASPPVIRKRLDKVIREAGLRAGKNGKRFEVPILHGFRRFFNKTVKDVSTNDTAGSRIRTEYMMGHQGVGSLDKNYYKTDVLELAAAYVMAVPDLTIDDADRLRLSNKRLSDKVRMAEDEKDEKMARMEAEMARMKEEAERLKEEKDERVERMEKELAELRGRGAPGTDLVAAFRGAANADGVPGSVVESLTGMMRQLEESRKADMQEMQEKHDAQIDELKRALDMERSGSWT